MHYLLGRLRHLTRMTASIKIFPMDKAILEAMSGLEQPWGEFHHRSYFLPRLDRVECDDYREILSEKVGRSVVPLGSPSKYAEGNMANLSPTIPINISQNFGKIENVYIGAACSLDEVETYTKLFKSFRDVFAWSYEEMPGIDPRIVEHEIKTYMDAKHV